MHIASKLTVALFLVLGVFFTQCSKKNNASVNMSKPEEVSLAFTKYVANLEFDKAKELTTTDGQQLIDMLKSMTSMISEEEMKQAKAESAESMKYLTKANCQVNGDDAVCYICCDAEGKADEAPMELKKVDGKWYVHFSKEDMMGGEGDIPTED